MREIALLVVLGILAVLVLFVNPTGWLARIAALVGMAAALITAAALLPDNARTSVMELFTPGQFIAIAGIALAINVTLVCAALYGVAKFYPEINPRLVTMTGFTLLSLVFVLAMSYWILSGQTEGCMREPLTKIDALYFTLTTLTTTGFGDVQPFSQVCRGLVSGQLVVGFIVITFLIGVLISRAASSLPPTNRSAKSPSPPER